LTISYTAILPVKPVAPNIITSNLSPSLAIADSSENRIVHIALDSILSVTQANVGHGQIIQITH
jgi:hypothetical protein